MAWRASLSRNVRELRFCCCNVNNSGAPVRYVDVRVQQVVPTLCRRSSSLAKEPTPVDLVCLKLPRILLIVLLCLCSEFFRNNYAELKALNPAFPLLLREGTGAEPYMLATYGECVQGFPMLATCGECVQGFPVLLAHTLTSRRSLP